jgi:hypothetical protein
VPPKSCRVSFTDDNGVEHSLTVQQLKRWADRTAISPAERIRKDRLKALLAR